MLNQLVELLKCAVIEQEINPLARTHLAGRMLLLNPGRAAALFRTSLTLAQLITL